jgi:hypothetical protein
MLLHPATSAAAEPLGSCRPPMIGMFEAVTDVGDDELLILSVHGNGAARVLDRRRVGGKRYNGLTS